MELVHVAYHVTFPVLLLAFLVLFALLALVLGLLSSHVLALVLEPLLVLKYIRVQKPDDAAAANGRNLDFWDGNIEQIYI